MPTIVCPQCNNDDSIQRVSAVVAGGISTGSFSGPTGAITYSEGKVGSAGGYTTLWGGSSTNLAKMLALPNEPTLRNTSLASLGIWFGIFLVVGEIILSIINNGDLFLGFGAMCYTIAFLSFLISIPYILDANSKNKKIKAIEKPNWDVFKKRWDQLYYCHKHGIVIDPDTGKTCEPPQIKEFVNDLIKDQIINPQSTTGETH